MPDDAVLDTLKFGIGQPVLRTEDPKLLTGRGEYTDDYNADGPAYATFLRSPVAHGNISALITDAAAAAPCGTTPTPRPPRPRRGSQAPERMQKHPPTHPPLSYWPWPSLPALKLR